MKSESSIEKVLSLYDHDPAYDGVEFIDIDRKLKIAPN